MLVIEDKESALSPAHLQPEVCTYHLLHSFGRVKTATKRLILSFPENPAPIEKLPSGKPNRLGSLISREADQGLPRSLFSDAGAVRPQVNRSRSAPGSAGSKPEPRTQRRDRSAAIIAQESTRRGRLCQRQITYQNSSQRSACWPVPLRTALGVAKTPVCTRGRISELPGRWAPLALPAPWLQRREVG